MLFKWHGILHFISQSGFWWFFSFTVYCCFMDILKTPADTDAGKSPRLVHCTKKSTSFQYKSLIFKLSLLSYITFKNNNFRRALFCKPIAQKCYISSYNLFHLVQTRDYNCSRLRSAPPPKKKWNLTVPVHFFPPHPGKGQIPTPGKALQINFHNSQMPGVCPGEGYIAVSIWSAHYS